jgi:hypothetical protein
MRPRVRSSRHRARAFSCALTAAFAAANGAARADEILVEITAPDGAGPTAFVLACNGATARDVTPARLTFQGAALDCEIRAEGPLEVVARSGTGSVARSRTSGGVVHLRLR